jgi:hypothetical protein
MKPLFSNFVKSPVTTIIGLSLFVLGSLGIYNGKLTVMWDGALVLFVSLTLTLCSDRAVKTYIGKVFNAALDFFKKSAPFLLILLLVSCGVTKNVNRNKEKAKVETDSSATVKEKATTTKITEEVADTTATIKSSEIKGSTPEKELDKKPFVLEDQNQKIEITKDSAGNLQVKGAVKEKVVDLKFRRRIEEKIVKDSQSKTHKSTSSETKKQTLDKDVRRYGFPWWAWLLAALVAIGSVLYHLKKRGLLPLPF